MPPMQADSDWQSVCTQARGRVTVDPAVPELARPTVAHADIRSIENCVTRLAHSVGHVHMERKPRRHRDTNGASTYRGGIHSWLPWAKRSLLFLFHDSNGRCGQETAEELHRLARNRSARNAEGPAGGWTASTKRVATDGGDGWRWPCVEGRVRERGKEKVGGKEKVEREREGREGKGIGAGGEKGRGCEGGRDAMREVPREDEWMVGTKGRKVERVGYSSDTFQQQCGMPISSSSAGAYSIQSQRHFLRRNNYQSIGCMMRVLRSNRDGARADAIWPHRRSQTFVYTVD